MEDQAMFEGLPPTVADVFRERLLEVREHKRWSQERLVQRLKEFGNPMDRATITKLEGGRRKKVLLDEALLFAAALGVSPIDLMLPREDDVRVRVGGLWVTAGELRRWMWGQQALFPYDERDYRYHGSREPAEMLDAVKRGQRTADQLTKLLDERGEEIPAAVRGALLAIVRNAQSQEPRRADDDLVELGYDPEDGSMVLMRSSDPDLEAIRKALEKKRQAQGRKV